MKSFFFEKKKFFNNDEYRWMYGAGRYAAYTHKYRYVARLYNTEIYVCVFFCRLYTKNAIMTCFLPWILIKIYIFCSFCLMNKTNISWTLSLGIKICEKRNNNNKKKYILLLSGAVCDFMSISFRFHWTTSIRWRMAQTKKWRLIFISNEVMKRRIFWSLRSFISAYRERATRMIHDVTVMRVDLTYLAILNLEMLWANMAN